MDGGNTHNSTAERDSLLYFNGGAYRLLLSGSVAGCIRLLKFGSREVCRAFLDTIAHDPAMRERRMHKQSGLAISRCWEIIKRPG